MLINFVLKPMKTISSHHSHHTFRMRRNYVLNRVPNKENVLEENVSSLPLFLFQPYGLICWEVFTNNTF